MTLSGSITEKHWQVAVETSPVAGGFSCHIRVSHDGENGAFERDFEHCKWFNTEREAVLDGLREGMIWVERKLSKTISV